MCLWNRCGQQIHAILSIEIMYILVCLRYPLVQIDSHAHISSNRLNFLCSETIDKQWYEKETKQETPAISCMNFVFFYYEN